MTAVAHNRLWQLSSFTFTDFWATERACERLFSGLTPTHLPGLFMPNDNLKNQISGCTPSFNPLTRVHEPSQCYAYKLFNMSFFGVFITFV